MNGQSQGMALDAHLLHELFSAAQIGLCTVDVAGGAVTIDDSFRRALRLDEGAQITTWAQLRALLPFDSSNVPQSPKGLASLAKSGCAGQELRVWRGDGSTGWIRANLAVAKADAQGEPTLLAVAIADIAAQRREQQLSGEKRRNEKIWALAGLTTWQWDVANNRLMLDEPAHPSAHGPLEMRASDLFDFVAAQDREEITKKITAYIAGGGWDRFVHDARVRLDGGSDVWIRIIAYVTRRDESGAPLLVCGGTLNIDQHRRDEESLKSALAIKERQSGLLEDEIERATRRLADARRTSGAMFNSNPHINLLVDMDLRILDGNPQAVRRLGFLKKEELIGKILPLTMDGAPDPQPAHRAALQERLKAMPIDGQIEFETELALQGVLVPFNVTIKKIPYGDGFALVVYMLDLLTIRDAKNDLKRRDALLQSVNEVATKLVSASPKRFDEVILESLGLICRSAGADRACIWENREDEGGGMRCVRTYQWPEAAAPPRAQTPALSVHCERMPFWRDSILSGRPINGPVAGLPAAERALLGAHGVLSVLAVPIPYAEKAWGFICFDDCSGERVFSQAEEQVLQSCGILMASAILRNQMTERLIKTSAELRGHDKLLRTVNNVAALFMGDATDAAFAQDVRLALKMLGEGAGADRAYIWRTDIIGGRMCCTEISEWGRGRYARAEGISPGSVVLDDILPGWQHYIESRSFINASCCNLGKPLRSLPAMQDVMAVAIIPIFIHCEFWGFIGFDNCRSDEIFSNAQADILRSGGMLIAMAIVRNHLTESLVEARESALASMRAKNEFLSRMSHEIRTPMNAIVGMTMIARKSNDVEKIHQFLKNVDSSSRQLLGLINDVLDMSKIDANKLAIASVPFDFERMMENVFNVIQVRVEEKRQDFQFDFQQVFTRNIISDELRLSQVLINLLSNAVKFTPDGGVITLKVRELPIDENHSILRVEVIDNGIGIQAERIPSLFDSFEQADGGITREYGGTGLGLAICKRIINLMGGDIWVQSEEGRGARFVFEINVGWGDSCNAKLAPAKLRENLRILVVDDTGDVLEYFVNILASFGLRCDTAQGGAQAVELARAALDAGNPYELIFLDWQMPTMSGAETARALRRVSGEEALFVVMSVSDWSDINDEVKAAGLAHFISKPILPSALYNTMVRITENTFVVERMLPDRPPSDWSHRRILLVEDILINQEVVAAILEDTGVSIDCAGDGRQAVDRFLDDPHRYDMILMDVQMPVLDGLSATRLIRASGAPRAHSIPILAMTANAFKEDERVCIDAGMNGHIPKPLEIDVLFAAIAKYLD